MRKNIKTTEGIFPMPVLMIATYNDDGSVNVMNAAWGIMLESNQVVLNLSESHKTFKNIMERKAFTVSIADSNHVKEADYFGMVSGNETAKKFENSKLTAIKSENVDEKAMTNDHVDIEKVSAIAFDSFTHGYYKVSERVGDAFKIGLDLK